MTNSTETTVPREITVPSETSPSTPVAPGTTAEPGAVKPENAAPATTEKLTIASRQANGNWNEQKSKLKVQFANLTETDLHYDNGKKDEMFSRIGSKLGKTNEELATIIAGL